MLGTPPAFVLSQDQTLKKLYLKAEALKSSFWINLSSKYTQEFSLAVLISSFTRFLNNPLIVQGVKNRLYVIQFTRYRRAFRSRGQLLHSIIGNPICQALFWSFLTFFVLLCIVLLPSWTACLCYHNTSHLSIPFFTFLDNSFHPIHVFPSDYLQEAEHTKI